MNNLKHTFVIVASISVAILILLVVFVLAPMNTSAFEAPAASVKESVTIHTTMKSGEFTVIANNIGRAEGAFWVKFECYDKSGTKLDDVMVHTPSIKHGESGKGTGFVPSGTYRYEVNKVVYQDGNDFRGVYFLKV